MFQITSRGRPQSMYDGLEVKCVELSMYLAASSYGDCGRSLMMYVANRIFSMLSMTIVFCPKSDTQSYIFDLTQKA